MNKLNTEDHKIASAKSAMAEACCDLDELIQAINELSIHLLVLPKAPVDIDIGFPKNYRQSIFDRAGENPLNIEINNIDGFIPSNSDNEKILRTLNWKTSKPFAVVYTTPKQSHATTHSPYTLALKSVLHEGKCDQYCPCGIDDFRRTYLNQEFFFQRLSSQNTKIELDDIFLIESDIKNIKKYLHANFFPNFSNVGGYQVNSWSNSLIKDINALNRHLYKDGVMKKLKSKHDKKARKKIIKSWLENRWKDNKDATKQCLNYAADIVDKDWPVDVNLKNISISEHEINRNQDSATNAMILIDISAERHMKKQTGYRGSKEYHDKLLSIGIETDTIRQSIYSFVKAKC